MMGNNRSGCQAALQAPEKFQSCVTHSMDEKNSNHELQLRANCAARVQRDIFNFFFEPEMISVSLWSTLKVVKAQI